LLQINYYRHPEIEKYAYITNVDLKDDELRIRTMYREYPYIKSKTLTKAVNAHPVILDTFPSGEGVGLDSYLARSNPSKKKLEMSKDYLCWGRKVPDRVNNAALTVNNEDLQKMFVKDQKDISDFNGHIAVNIANYLDPKQLGISTDDVMKGDLKNFLKMLTPKSFELYLPEYEEVSSLKNSSSYHLYDDLMSFLSTKPAIQELIRHTNVLDAGTKAGET